MTQNWRSKNLATEAEVFYLLTEVRGKRWLSRGQAKRYNCLVPSIDLSDHADEIRAQPAMTLETTAMPSQDDRLMTGVRPPNRARPAEAAARFAWHS
jgi:hypothetical protein